MWTKYFSDGRKINEDRTRKITWTSTPLTNIDKVELRIYIKNNLVYKFLEGYLEYWHSRTAFINTHDGSRIEALERIQGLRIDGKWDTIEWNGKTFTEYTTDLPIGKPVK